MQTSNLKFISRGNQLRQMALKNSPEFGNALCEFICEEFQFQSALLLKINDANKLVVVGKSSTVKKNYLPNTLFDCVTCKFLQKDCENFDYYSDQNCSIQSTDFVINEACLYIKTSDSKYILKISQKTPFTVAEKEFFQIVGAYLQSLLENAVGLSSQGISLSKFIAETANEFRTPTNSIVGFTSLLQNEKLSAAQTEYVTTLRENAHKLLATLNDLIDLAKVESGTITDNFVSFDIRSLIEELIAQYSDKLEKFNLTVERQVDKNLPDTLKLETQKLKYILQQCLALLINTTESGKIAISATLSSSNTVSFRLWNQGNIIPITNITKLFNGHLHSEIKNQKGPHLNALSMLLAKKLVEHLGGNLEITSSSVKGTSISFGIKVEVLGALESKISALPKIEGGKNKVLVIEDDYATSKLLSNYLNKWGYEPSIVNSGLKGLDLLKKDKYLAVIMDIVLPDINGLELLKKIREDESSKFTPVIVCSVEAEQQKAFLMGAVEYFVKPIRYKDLVEVLTSYKLKKDSNVLCVDDDVPTLNLVKGAIESVGFNPITESDSTKVMNRIKDIQLDLAIIDLDMPEINGFELIKMIKSTPKFANLPIIIYTGKENFDEDLQKIDGLFTELLSKRSTKIEDLADTINAMINRYEQPTSSEEVKNTEADVPKILLVEDYKHSQIIVTRLLKKNGFTSVAVVENGAEAIEQVKLQSFDLILMDMQMPVMNGFEATERIRQIPEYVDTPIIALTAFAMKGDREKCIEAGATDYIPKPIDSVEFIEKVKFYTSQKAHRN